ncbi:MAG: hypothetical protein IPH07_30125 [Deltaproteobacteria bacterium]|nr:hypothetical protein [Deltaproteobacteria bacterium]
MAGLGVSSLLALSSDRVPNLEARALSPTVGWLVLLALASFIGLCILHADRWRRVWLRAEDPRTIGLFRILFAIALLLNVVGMWEQLEFLFTDEGLFYTDSARKLLAAKQFAGYIEGEHEGFVSGAAVLEFLRGPRYSLLLLRSDPAFFWLHLWAFVGATVAMLVGWRTRTATIVAWLLMTSLTGRNPIYWTGADVVYKAFFFLLVLSRSGHAYSVDNWLRCRKLRRAGRLRTREHQADTTREPIHRRIPAWPRMLMILQLATVYLYTGSAKTGGIWAAGDSLYYALNLDHFYRMPPQLMSQLFATNIFRVMTWTVHFWQIGFPLLLVGMVTRFQLREGFTPLPGWRGWLTRLGWTVIGLASLGVCVVALPVHYVQHPGGPSVQVVQWSVATGWLLAMVAIALLWRKLRDRPPVFTVLGQRIRVDLQTACTWFLGRRLWLTIGVFFHLQIFMLMNIGMFAPIMIMVYLCCLNGSETASLLRALGRILHRLRVPGIPADVARGEPPLPAESADSPRLHHDGAAMPRAALLLALLAAIGFVCAHAFAWPRPLAPSFVALGVLGLVAGAISGWRRRGTAGGDHGPWAYGPVGRTLANAIVVTHITAVALHCIPDKDSCWSFRGTAGALVKPWLDVTQTAQSWDMFAPNPMRTNDFLEVLVTDAAGETWDLRTDVNSPRNKQIPWIWYDRAGKITRRVIGEGKWYRSWLARYHCRRWALDHDGEMPRTVELVRVWYEIPPPDKVARLGYYRPAELLAREGHRSSLLTVTCATEEDGQLTNEIRARHGLPQVDERTIRRRHPKRDTGRFDPDAAD